MLQTSVTVHHSSNAARVYRIPLELFPGLSGYAHLVFADDYAVLIDVGSGVGYSNEHLEAGLKQIRENFGENADWESLTHVLITHAHIDHFGGLRYVRKRTTALLGVHKLDLRVLTGYEERLRIVAHRLTEYLIEAGVSSDERQDIMDLYLLNKHLFESVEVDFTYDEADMQVGPLRLTHVPGHCPGQVVLQIDDLLFSADHILKDTTPHQAPEQLSMNTGLGHYLESLEKIRPLARSVRISFGGHEDPIIDLEKRIDEIVGMHSDRLAAVLKLLERPLTIADISNNLFPKAEGYHVLLALEEAGAHIEYLAQRGYLSILNLDDMQPNRAVPIIYRRRSAQFARIIGAKEYLIN